MILQTCYSMPEVAFLYRNRFALPVDMAGGRPSLVIGDEVGAAAMEPRLGAPVRDALCARGIVSVPVISHDRPGHDRWVFVLRPEPFIKAPIPHVPEVDVLQPGTRVWLPTSDAHTSWYWIAPPARSTSPGGFQAPTRVQVLRAARSVRNGHPFTQPARG